MKINWKEVVCVIISVVIFGVILYGENEKLKTWGADSVIEEVERMEKEKGGE
jgi:hypothetical protein